MEQIKEILTDLYINSNTYEGEDVTKMLQITQNRKNIGISLRAGMLSNGSKWNILKRLLDQIQESFLVINRQPGDREALTDISTFVESFREESLYVGFSHQEHLKLARIPKPKDSIDSNGSIRTNQMSYLQFLIVLVLTYVMK